MRRLFIHILVFAAITAWLGPDMSGGSAVAGPRRAEIEGVRLWAAPDNTRVVLDLSKPVEHQLFTLRNPDRVVIDLKPGSLDTSRVALPDGQGHVLRIRTANRPDGAVRVVLDLASKVQPKSFYVKPNDVYGHRLVIDLVRTGVPVPVKTVPRMDGRDLVVMIDPGHGGEDPGASGRRGTREKDVVLSISKRLKKRINSEPGMRAFMTRDSDYFLSHDKRKKQARKHQADLFVSIHADSFRDRRARGSSVYVLSSRGASDEAARWLAERENAADLVGGVSLDDKDDVLAEVLLDLSQTATLSASMGVGDYVAQEMRRVGTMHKNKLSQAGFVVLKSPDIPSILVELAFISNPDEEKKLRDPKHQKRWADAMLSGIRAYFYQNPPPGTRLAMNRSSLRDRAVEHVITRGDTLSGIAHRYNVSLRSLRRENKIRGDRIRIGQVLSIPSSTGT